jgi:SEC-C motif
MLKDHSTKVGRNHPCPCGSGKKFKRCHGAAQPKANSQEGGGKITAKVQDFGLPGQLGSFTVVPVFKDDDPRNPTTANGLPGRYKVVFTLCRPGLALNPERDFAAADHLVGTSHLAIARPALDTNIARIQITVGLFTFIGSPNDNGFLSKIETECDASDFQDAHYKSMAALTPTLSHWALRLDVPIQIYQTDIVELRTQSIRFTIRTAFLEASFGAPLSRGELTSELQSYASVYREALISNSPIYEFICYYRIVESIHARRKRLSREAKSRSESLSFPVEHYPASPETLKQFLDEIFVIKPTTWNDLIVGSLLLPEVVGKEFTVIDESYLKPLRNRAAHTILNPSLPELRADDAIHVEEINRWLPVTKCIARRLLITEFPSQLS